MKNFINELEKIDYRTRKTKEALVGALSSIVKEKRLTDITVSELARRASVTRRTFYNHYASVEAMVHDVEERVIGTVLSMVERNRELFRAGETYEFFLRLAGALRNQKLLWHIFSAAKENYKILERLKSCLEIYIRQLMPHFEEDEFMTFRIHVYLDSLIRMFVRWMEHPVKVSNEKIAEMASRMTEALLGEEKQK